jgi:hypothetical protein
MKPRGVTTNSPRLVGQCRINLVHSGTQKERTTAEYRTLLSNRDQCLASHCGRPATMCVVRRNLWLTETVNEPLERWMPQHPLVCHVRIRDFRLVARLDPGRVALPDWLHERWSGPRERRKGSPDGASRRVVPTRADAPHVHKRATQLCQAAGTIGHEADYHEPRSLPAFHLAPVLSAPRTLGGVRALRDDALQLHLGCMHAVAVELQLMHEAGRAWPLAPRGAARQGSIKPGKGVDCALGIRRERRNGR